MTNSIPNTLIFSRLIHLYSMITILSYVFLLAFETKYVVDYQIVEFIIFVNLVVDSIKLLKSLKSKSFVFLNRRDRIVERSCSFHIVI